MPTIVRTAAHAADRVARWTFLTNHAHVLLCLAGDPELRVRDIAERVGVTERAVLRILGDLVEAGYLAREREGRRTHYRMCLDRPMRHPVEAARSVRVLVEALADARTSSLVGSLDPLWSPIDSFDRASRRERS